MLKEFYFIRHGQTDANLNRFMAGGNMDISINQTGLEQARKAAFKLSAKIPVMGSICTSPMARAVQTARLISTVYECQVTKIEELREWDVGEWEGVPFHTVESAFFGAEDPPSGETRVEFRKRVMRGLELAVVEAAPVLVVGHGGVWRATQEVLGLEPVRISNCVPVRVYRDGDGRWTFAEV